MVRNVSLIIISLAVLFAILEYGIFNFVLLPSEIPRLQEGVPKQVLKYQPNQTGTWRVGNHIASPYQINNQGWNSAHKDYVVAKSVGTTRIAIVGDSYIEALQVPYDRSVAEILESLRSHYQVYRFGISGAPLSQYIEMLENEVLLYQPDIVVINIVHNDFLESLEGKQVSTFSSSFRTWRLLPGGKHIQVPPTPYKRNWISLVKSLNVFGYLVPRKGMNIQFYRDLFLNHSSNSATESDKYVMNVPVNSLDDPQVIRIIEIFAKEVKNLVQEAAVQPHVIVIMDGPRGRSIESCRNRQLSPRLAFLHDNTAFIMHSYGIEFYDLWTHFFDKECTEGLNLKIPKDGHWSESGHLVVAEFLDSVIARDIE